MRTKKKTGKNNANDSMMSTNSLAIEETEFIGLIKDLDIESLNS